MNVTSFLCEQQDLSLAEPRIDEGKPESRCGSCFAEFHVRMLGGDFPMRQVREDATMRKIVVTFAIALGVSVIGVASQQYPVVDALAGKIVQKYQSSTCDQLWQERSQGRSGQPKSPHEQQAIQMLQNNPQMRAEFINRVAAPIANKMFECG